MRSLGATFAILAALTMGWLFLGRHRQETGTSHPSSAQSASAPSTRKEVPLAAALNKVPLRESPDVSLHLAPKPPDDRTTGLVVYLEGRVSKKALRRRWDLTVCGLPASPGHGIREALQDDAMFRVRRSFPRAGTYVVSAVLRPLLGSERYVTDCRITVASTPEEDAHLHDMMDRVSGLRGGEDVDAQAEKELALTQDLRVAPALWRVIEEHPGADSPVRQDAVDCLAFLPDLDSIPRLIRLLKDKGIRKNIFYSLTCFVLARPLELSGNLLEYERMTTDEGQADRYIAFLLKVFHEEEPQLRRALHQ
jgi:hypothetical protein